MPKKKFAVYPRTKEIVRTGLQTGRGQRDFNYNKSLMNISDAGEAKEIEEKYGAKGSQDVHVIEDEKYSHAVNGEQWDVRGSDVKTVHHYTFGASPKYANAWEEFEARRTDKPKRNAKRRRRSAEVAHGIDP